MIILGLCLTIVHLCAAQQLALREQTSLALDEAYPDFTFSREWKVVGPFQIGTREATWGADPLEFEGGFHNLPHHANATFRSALAPNGTVSWTTHAAQLSYVNENIAYADLSVSFPDIDWKWMKEVYGWTATQWQGWARGEVYVKSSTVGRLLFRAQSVLEYWIDDVHYWGGDFFNYRKVPVPLHLEAGVHKIELRLIRDVRSMGGVGEPNIDIKLELERARSGLDSLGEYDKDVLIADVVGGDWGPLASPYATILLRNNGQQDIHIERIGGMPGVCLFELLADSPIKVAPGQSRPIGFKLGCVTTYVKRIYITFKYRVGRQRHLQPFSTSIWPRVLQKIDEPQRVTYVHPAGVVSYFILRPPPQNFECGRNNDTTLPVLISLHGAGVEADDDLVKHALDDLSDLCAWVVFPTGVTPWSGDDWHNWGLADVEAAVAAIPRWIERTEWQGAGVDINRWLVSGHSNGGQGTWYLLTHRPDKIIAAAVLSAYSSIQNYVPYTLWHTAEPGKESIVQSALLPYRHELLMENAMDIPVLQQHGNADDNVPVYNARLMSQRIYQAGADSEYWEIPNRGHFWDGVLQTQPIKHFFRKHLARKNESDPAVPLHLHDFTLVVADPGDMGSKNGIKVLGISVPGKLGKVSMTFNPLTRACLFRVVNVWALRFPVQYSECSHVMFDGQFVNFTARSGEGAILIKSHGQWSVVDSDDDPIFSPSRSGRQQGAMDSILRTIGIFSIVKHSPGTDQVALQISRNFCQYFGADAEITDDYRSALSASENIISIAVGTDLPQNSSSCNTIWIVREGLSIKYGDTSVEYSATSLTDLVAIFLRPLPDERLELVVWASKESSLPIAARLVPMLTGSGQPDFVVADRTMMWKGVEGVLALGFFDNFWHVTSQSHLT